MLTRKQLDSIIINAIAVKMLITFPHNIIEICQNAAWISAIYCLGIALLLFFTTCRIYRSDKNMISLSEKHGGKTLRIFTGIIVFVVLFANFFTLLRIFPEVIRLVLLQKTYVELITLFLIVCIVLGAYCGLEAIARVQELFIPIAGIVFIGFVALLSQKLRLENIFPLLGPGAYRLFVSNIPFLSVFSDIIILNLLIPHMQDFSDYRKVGLRSILIGGAFAVLIISAYCLSYSFPVTEKYLMPVYQLERLVYLRGFFSRLEAIFQFFWSISILLYGSLYLYMIAETWKTTFDLKETKPLILPIASISIGLSLIPENLHDTIVLETILNRWLYLPAFFLPAILGIADVSRETIKNRRQTRQAPDDTKNGDNIRRIGEKNNEDP